MPVRNEQLLSIIKLKKSEILTSSIRNIWKTRKMTHLEKTTRIFSRKIFSFGKICHKKFKEVEKTRICEEVEITYTLFYAVKLTMKFGFNALRIKCGFMKPSPVFYRHPKHINVIFASMIVSGTGHQILICELWWTIYFSLLLHIIPLLCEKITTFT